MIKPSELDKKRVEYIEKWALNYEDDISEAIIPAYAETQRRFIFIKSTSVPSGNAEFEMFDLIAKKLTKVGYENVTVIRDNEQLIELRRQFSQPDGKFFGQQYTDACTNKSNVGYTRLFLYIPESN